MTDSTPNPPAKVSTSALIGRYLFVNVIDYKDCGKEVHTYSVLDANMTVRFVGPDRASAMKWITSNPDPDEAPALEPFVPADEPDDELSGDDPAE